MWSLARRFSENPLGATLLFVSVPAFIINGNSFEADLPFVAFWMAGITLFVARRYALSAFALDSRGDDGLSGCDRDTDSFRLLLAARPEIA